MKKWTVIIFLIGMMPFHPSFGAETPPPEIFCGHLKEMSLRPLFFSFFKIVMEKNGEQKPLIVRGGGSKKIMALQAQLQNNLDANAQLKSIQLRVFGPFATQKFLYDNALICAQIKLKQSSTSKKKMLSLSFFPYNF